VLLLIKGTLACVYLVNLGMDVLLETLVPPNFRAKTLWFARNWIAIDLIIQVPATVNNTQLIADLALCEEL